MWPWSKKMEGILAKRSRKEFLNRDDLDFLNLYENNLNDDDSYELK